MGQRKRYSAELKTKVAFFSTRASERQKSEEELIATLYQQIGHVIRAGGLVGKKIKSIPLVRNARSLNRGILT